MDTCHSCRQQLPQSIVLAEEQLATMTAFLQSLLAQQQLSRHTTNNTVAIGIENFQRTSPTQHSSARVFTYASSSGAWGTAWSGHQTMWHPCNWRRAKRRTTDSRSSRSTKRSAGSVSSRCTNASTSFVHQVSSDISADAVPYTSTGEDGKEGATDN